MPALREGEQGDDLGEFEANWASFEGDDATWGVL